MCRGQSCPRPRLPHVIIVIDIAPDRESNRGVEPRGKKLRLPRSVRLLRHADFERVYKQGRRHFSSSITVFYLRRPVAAPGDAKRGAPSGLRVGFTVGRALGGAVQRNRMKRRLREAVRLSRPKPGPEVDVVINPKKSLLAHSFAAVVKEVGRALVVITEKLEKPERVVPKSE